MRVGCGCGCGGGGGRIDVGRAARFALPTDPVESTGTRGAVELAVEVAVCEFVPVTATAGKPLAFVSFEELFVSRGEGCCCSGAHSCGDVSATEEDSGTMRSCVGAVDNVTG